MANLNNSDVEKRLSLECARFTINDFRRREQMRSSGERFMTGTLRKTMFHDASVMETTA